MALEARLAARHDRALRSAGAAEPPDDVLPLMQVAYPVAFLAMAAEAWAAAARSEHVFIAGPVVFVLAKGMKYWAIATLGDRWTFRVLVPPRVDAHHRRTLPVHASSELPRRRGELAGMALMAQAPIAGTLSIIVFGMLMVGRIRVEERALAAASDREKGKGK